MQIHEQILERDEAPLAVVTWHGVPSAGDRNNLPDRIDALGEAGVTRIVLDMSGVGWLGAAEIGALTGSLALISSRGGDLRLTGVSRHVQRALAIAHLADRFLAFGSVEAAVESFLPASPDHAGVVNHWNTHLPQYVLEPATDLVIA